MEEAEGAMNDAQDEEENLNILVDYNTAIVEEREKAFQEILQKF